MKTLKTLAFSSSLFLGAGAIYAQDSLGVIGDNLDLYAVLDAFKDAASMEEFEQTINDQSLKINNLDLNEDNQVDYIQVYDEGDEDDVHAIVLRIAMEEGDEGTQDVAVIELEKTNSNEANIQIIGDEDLYGTDYIIEPKNPDELTKRVMAPNLIIVNVWGWRGVRVVFAPGYVRWRSPYYWRHYPRWWRPWRPFRWRTYHSFHVNHHRYYHPVRVRRCGRAHRFYVKRRRHCPKIVHHHHHHHYKGHQGHKNQNGNKSQTKTNGQPQKKNQSVKNKTAPNKSGQMNQKKRQNRPKQSNQVQNKSQTKQGKNQVKRGTQKGRKRK